MDELLRRAKDAVRGTVESVRQSRPHILGLALVTDDGLETLGCCIADRDAILIGGDDLLFSPMDWPIHDEDGFFDAARRALKMARERLGFEEHVRMAFLTLEQALGELRQEGVFSSDVFLAVLSSDPCPELEANERVCVERLNSREVTAARERFLERWR